MQTNVSNPSDQEVYDVDAPSGAHQRPLLRRVIVAASIGTFIEYFDIVVYGAMAVVISTVFFPAEDPTAALLNTFAVFALAFVARPLGGLFWGPLGDRIGRKRTLSAIILVMSSATALIGMLPTYDQIGIIALIALVVLRFIQGISAGGEMAGAAIFIGEYAPASRRAFLTSFLQSAVTIAQISALLVAALMMGTLSSEAMHSWGWRLPFLLALPVGAVGLYIRSRLEETPVFDEAEGRDGTVDKPLRTLLGSRSGWRMIGRVVLVNLPCSVPGYLLLTFMPAYLVTSMDLSGGQALLAVSLAVVIVLICQPLGGYLSDRFGRRPILRLVAASQLLVALPAFLIINIGGLAAATGGLALIGVTYAFAVGSQAAPTLESFPTRIRFTGYAFALGLTTAVLAGPTPYVATWLVAATGSPLAPAGLMAAVVIPTLVGSFFFRETAGTPLGDVR